MAGVSKMDIGARIISSDKETMKIPVVLIDHNQLNTNALKVCGYS